MKIILIPIMMLIPSKMIMMLGQCKCVGPPASPVGGIHREREESVLRITPRLMNLFKGPK